jgi:hypothetical protein
MYCANSTVGLLPGLALKFRANGETLMSQNILFIRRIVFVIPLLLNLIVFASVATQGQDLPIDTVNALLDPKTLGLNKHKKPIYPKGIVSGRYMEDDIHGKCPDATFQHWEEFHFEAMHV